VLLLAPGVLCAWATNGASATAGAQPENFFADPSFEMRALDETGWHLDKAGKTEARFAINNGDAAVGDRSAQVTIGPVEEWGTQFGRKVDAGQKAKTYTFAVVAKAVQQPVQICLQIERCAKPFDRAAVSEPVLLNKDGWTETHVTFTVEKDFSEGWFAYISCTQSNGAYRADMFRLYEGAYVPYQDVIPKTAASGSVSVFDLGTRATAALTAEAVGQRDGWKEMAAGQTCGGDICVANGSLALVLRKQAPGAECYYQLGGQWVPGPKLMPATAGGEPAQKTGALRVIESTPVKVIVEAGATTAAGRAILVRYSLRRNQPMVELQPGAGMGRIVVEAPGRYAVLPDIFGGDLVVSAAQARAGRLRFPSERLAAQLLDGGNAIVVCAWPSDSQGVKLTVHGEGAAKWIATTEIECGREKARGVWVAVLAAPGIWYQQPIAGLDPVKDVKPEWKVPFRALWRADFQRMDGLIDSWRCIIKKPNNEFEGFGVAAKKKSRTVWSSARGTYAYPVCLDGDSMCLRNTRFDGLPEAKGDPAGQVVLYPFRRVSGSPEAVWGVFDVLTDALQDTAEAACLDELQIKRVPRDRYPATCAVTAEYEKLFADRAEQAKRAEILKLLEEMDQFCIGIRSRMDEYLAWAKQTHELCAAEKAAKPQLGALVDELDGIIGRFPGVFEKLKLGERTPEAARALSAQVRALIDSNEDKKDEKANQLGRATRTIGGSQDESIGRFRTLARQLRQRAGYRMIEAPDDATFEFARAMRARTLEVLQCAFGHEGASTE
jgi:hypothetical protein